MATSKLFSVVGVSKLGGEYKVRFATDTLRVKVLEKHNHEDVRLVQLDTAMTKYEGIKTIQSWDEFKDAAAQSAIMEYLEANAPKAAAKPAPVKAPAKASKATAKKSAVKADENLPFGVEAA
jgi:hypothetical protein